MPRGRGRGRGIFRGRGLRGKKKSTISDESKVVRNIEYPLQVQEPEDDSKSLRLDNITDNEAKKNIIKQKKPRKKKQEESNESGESEEEGEEGSEGSEEDNEEEESEGTQDSVSEATTSGSDKKKAVKKKGGKTKKDKKKEEKPKLSEKLKFSDNKIKEKWNKKNDKKQEKTLERISSKIYSFAKEEEVEDDSSLNSEGEDDQNESDSDVETINPQIKSGRNDLFKEETKKLERLEFIFSFLKKQTNQMRKLKRLNNDIMKDPSVSQEIKDHSKSLQIEFVRDLQMDMKNFVKESNNVLKVLDSYDTAIEGLYREKKISALSYHATMVQLGYLYERRKALKDNLESI